jgi:hypothetical protein
MIWDSIKTFLTELFKPSIPVQVMLPPTTPPYPPSPASIKFLSMKEVDSIFDTGGGLQVSLIREGCDLMKVPFVGGGTMFVSKQDTLELELEEIKAAITLQLRSKCDYIVAYDKQDKKHHNLSFYSIIAIRSSDLLDLKKALRIHKLKAFL